LVLHLRSIDTNVCGSFELGMCLSSIKAIDLLTLNWKDMIMHN